MTFIEAYSLAWIIIEPLIFAGVIVLFFSDPIRRWNFFGYRPTAVMGLYDPNLEKVLLVVKKDESWYAFSQGGIYNPDINFTCHEILKRELGLKETSSALRYTQSLGALKIKNYERMNRATFNSVSIFSRLRGKGYIACYIRIDLKENEGLIQTGEGIGGIKILSVEEAKKVISAEVIPNGDIDEQNEKKKKMILLMLEEMGHLIESYQKQYKECSTLKEEED